MRIPSLVRRTVRLGFAIATVAAGIQFASAHGDATGVVLERHTLMTELRDLNKSVGAMMRDSTNLDRDELALNAQRMAELAARMTRLFPDTGPSRQGAGNNTRQNAWQEFSRFETIANALAERATALAKSAGSESPANLEARARAMGDTCKQCHKSYRRKKQH